MKRQRRLPIRRHDDRAIHLSHELGTSRSLDGLVIAGIAALGGMLQRGCCKPRILPDRGATRVVEQPPCAEHGDIWRRGSRPFGAVASVRIGSMMRS